MLNYKNEAVVGYDIVAHIYSDLFPGPVDLTNYAYFSTLFNLAAAAEPSTVVEIGTQGGFSTKAFLAATPQVDRERRAGGGWVGMKGPERIVHSIDPDPKCAELSLGPRWHFHLGKSQDLEPFASDFLYVDGDHNYNAVCSDMLRWGTLVKDGGLVVLDDYHWSWPDKVRWVNERWKALDPLIIGPTAVVRVTSEKRKVFAEVFS